ncbi:MAG: hypothetical protein KIT84_19930 [Labilithrix sp.]|nr:hypothetical protein [Labilithrix sp.]MCW5813308.1 hypothetical protein [Labilithrix sp.]
MRSLGPLCALALAACTSAAETDAPPVPVVVLTDEAPRVDEAAPAPATGGAPEEDGVVPKLFVRGFGAGAPGFVDGMRSFDTYKKLMIAAGFDGERHAHDLGDYDDGSDLAGMVGEIGAKLEGVMAGYPATTKFDVLGHSLGGIIALRAVLDRKMTPRVRAFVALSSPIYGQDKQPFNCRLGFRCTDVYTTYSPFQSAPVMAYMDEHRAELASIVRCSVISPQDGTIDTPMAGGQFPDGKNVVVADVSHMKLMKSEVAFAAMKEECFDGKL